MSTTKENLEFAFAGESQANRKYLFFAEKAAEEGHKYIARYFKDDAIIIASLYCVKKIKYSTSGGSGNPASGPRLILLVRSIVYYRIIEVGLR